MVFCSQCGTKAVVGGNFCQNCGSPLAVPPPASQPLYGRGGDHSRDDEWRERGRQSMDRQDRREAPWGRDRDRSQERSQNRGGHDGCRERREGSDYGRLRHDDRHHAGWEREVGARSREARGWAESRNTERGRERDRARERDSDSDRFGRGDRGYAHSDRGGLSTRADQGIHPPPARDMERAGERGARRPMRAEDGMQVLHAGQWHSMPRHGACVRASSVHTRARTRPSTHPRSRSTSLHTDAQRRTLTAMRLRMKQPKTHAAREPGHRQQTRPSVPVQRPAALRRKRKRRRRRQRRQGTSGGL